MGAAAAATMAPTSYSMMVQLMKAMPPMSSTMAGAMAAVTRLSAACSQMPTQSTRKRRRWGTATGRRAKLHVACLIDQLVAAGVSLLEELQHFRAVCREWRAFGEELEILGRVEYAHHHGFAVVFRSEQAAAARTRCAGAKSGQRRALQRQEVVQGARLGCEYIDDHHRLRLSIHVSFLRCCKDHGPLRYDLKLT